MRTLKFGVKKLLRVFNLELRSFSPSPFWCSELAEADPLTFQYLESLRASPIISINLAQARAGVMGFDYTSPVHPLLLACRAALREADPVLNQKAIHATLTSYYEAVQPRTALEVVDLTEEDAPGLSNMSKLHWVFPWSERSVEETAKHRRICLEEEGLAYSVRLSAADGMTLYGPAGTRKLDLETRRIKTLMASFSRVGYRADPTNPIEVMALRSGEKYRWLIHQGQHRAAACAAIDCWDVKARIIRIIRREDVRHWPHVLSGTYTPAGAEMIFDRLFAGSPTSCASLHGVNLAETTVDSTRAVSESGVRFARRERCTAAR